MKLNTGFDLWLFNNIRRFFQQDPIFRNFNTHVITADLKKKICSKNNYEELLKSLDSEFYNSSYKSVRKVDGDIKYYYEYPSLKFQLETLVDVYKEALLILKSENDLTSYNFSDDSFLQIHDTGNIEEEEFELYKYKNSLDRNVFGNKLNKNTYLSKIDEEKKISIDKTERLIDRERYKNSSIKLNYKFEYNCFSFKVLNEIKRVAESKKDGIFFQTDLVKFYHCLKIDQIISFFSHFYEGQRSQKIRESLEKIKDLFHFDSLPIGWIYSGIISNIILIKFYQEFQIKITSSIKNDEVMNQVQNVELISFADDLIFIIEFKKYSKETSIESITDRLTSIVEEVFVTKLFFPSVTCHKPNTDKVKSFVITSDFSKLANTNFMKFDTGTYVDGEADWGHIGSLISPIDNDLALNTNVVFVQNLKQIKDLISEGTIGIDDFLSKYINILIFKLSNGGLKYISYITMVASEVIKNDAVSKTFDGKKFESVFMPITEKVIESDMTTDVVLKFLKKIFDLFYYEYLDEESFFSALKIYYKVRNEFFKKHGGRKNFVFDVFESELKLISIVRGFKSDLRFYDDHFSKQFYLSSCLTLPNIGSDSNEYHVASLGYMFRRTGKIRCFVELLFENMFKHSSDRPKFKEKIRRVIEETLYLYINELYSKEMTSLFGMLSETRLYETLTKILELKKGEIKKYGILEFQTELGELINGDINYFNKSGSSDEKILNLMILALFYLVADNDERSAVLSFWLRNLEKKSLINWPVEARLVNGNFDLIHTFIRKLFFSKTNELHDKSYVESLLEILAVKIEELSYFREKRNGLEIIDLDYILKNYNKAYFKNLNKDIKLSICRIGIDWKNDIHSMQFNSLSRERINTKILNSISSAIKDNTDIIIIPELTLPRKYLHKYLSYVASFNKILIAGLEYRLVKSGNAYNQTIISIPTKSKNIDGSTYHCFIQTKRYPATDEALEIRRLELNYVEGTNQFLFRSSKWQNFSVLTCSDFLSTTLKSELKGRIQTLFVPAQNYDSTTYTHLAESALRELYCYCVICNNNKMGSSGVYAPYRDAYKRELFKISGESLPNTNTVTIQPSVIDLIQSNCNRNIHFKTHNKLKIWKQLPPDWKKKSG
ncbi:hypothetical protein HBN50_03270 [Halobacteriovorax sp. GB3]|uniref:hypothetical protein n=1 Tax=Halobacteriovorax sp. GB3 TaxID=2719615 RepID=UPI00235F9125|nr:hypothetical protein [Halobacteriovorax sp. GB3]MDD0852097.1 hypothetical protein [Halobacteriovorax sp. GB3]